MANINVLYCLLFFLNVNIQLEQIVQNLERNTRLYSEVTPLKCEICLKYFQTLDYLINRQKIHANVIPFECHTCGKNFSDNAHLIKHIETHRDATFGCEACICKFKKKITLKNHKLYHTGQRKFLCKTCFQAFDGFYPDIISTTWKSFMKVR